MKLEVGRLIVLNRLHHGSICAVCDGIAEAGFLAFELKPEFAIGTGKVTGLRVVRQPGKFWR